MPISSATEPPAAAAAFGEAEKWAAVAARWHPDRNAEIWADVPARETAVIPEVDPGADLGRRALRWGYPMERGDLSDLALFAAALATTEGEAWEAGNGSLATQAYEDRRFLAGDRIVPWAVPWLRAVARCFPSNREDATAAGVALLDMGERHRLAPALAGSEGLVAPGHDGYGPHDEPVGLARRLGSLWGGMVVFHRSLCSLTGDKVSRGEWPQSPEADDAVATWYEVAAARWERLAEHYPGTATYWLDLAARSLATMRIAQSG